MRWARRSCCSNSGGGQTSLAEYSILCTDVDGRAAEERDSFGELEGRRVKSMDYWRLELRIYIYKEPTASIHHPFSNSCNTMRDFSVSIESTASPFEKLLVIAQHKQCAKVEECALGKLNHALSKTYLAQLFIFFLVLPLIIAALVVYSPAGPCTTCFRAIEHDLIM